MKNVTKILTAVVLCAAVFASTQRTDALGVNPAFWPGDEANISAFPAQVNNHGYVQLSNVASGAGKASADMVFNHNGTAWGLSFADDATNDNEAGFTTDPWVNIMWGKNGMGISFALENETDAASSDYAAAVANTSTINGTSDGCTDGGTSALGDWSDCDNSTAQVGTAEVTHDDYAFAYGNSFDWGEIGVTYNSDGDIGFNYRKACGFWVFTDMVANLDMPDCPSGDDTCGMGVTADWFTHWDASGADVMFAMGFDYDEASAELTQTAAVGVEANMTDWASFRAGVNWEFQLAGDDDRVGQTAYGWATGLGFNWGGFTADMTIEDELLRDPVGNMTGNNNGNDTGLTTSAMTLTYSF